MLLYDAMSPCTKVERTKTNDGVGGFDWQWVDGETFQAAVVKQASPVERVAEKQGVKESYLISFPKGFHLGFHDVFRREKDGMIFRVVSNVEDSETPPVATFQIGQVTAERWELT